MAKKIRLQKLSINSFCTGNGRSFGKSMSNPNPNNQQKTLFSGVDEINFNGNPTLQYDSGKFCVNQLESLLIYNDFEEDNDFGNYKSGALIDCNGPDYQLMHRDLQNYFNNIDLLLNGYPVPLQFNLHELPSIQNVLPHVEEIDYELPIRANGTDVYNGTMPDAESLNICGSDYYICETEGDYENTGHYDPDSYVLCASDWEPCQNTENYPS